MKITGPEAADVLECAFDIVKLMNLSALEELDGQSATRCSIALRGIHEKLSSATYISPTRRN